MASPMIIENKTLVELNYELLSQLKSLSDSEPVTKNTVKKLKRNDGNGNLVIDNSYYSKINQIYHTKNEVDETNINLIRYRKFNDLVHREVQFINKLDRIPKTSLSPSSDGIYRVTLYHCKIVFYKGILNIRHNKAQKLKASLVCSYNLESDENNIVVEEDEADQTKMNANIQSLFEEIGLLNVANSRSANSLDIDRPLVEFEIDPIKRRLTTTLKYHVQYGCYVNQTILPTITVKINKVIAPQIKPYPIFEDLELVDDIGAQLFYNSMSKTAVNTPQPENFELPELETKLLRFQTKTVNWLLNKESVRYNWETNRSQNDPLISVDLVDAITEQLKQGHNSDDVDKKVYHVINKLVFGWERVLFNDKPFWYNKYNANLIDWTTMYQYILNYHNSKLPEILPGQGLLAEEMGLGKTVEVVSLALLNQRPISDIDEIIQLQLRQHGDLKPVIKAKTTLIIAPDSILKQWVSEVQRLAPSLAVTVYQGLDKYPKFKNNAKIIANYLKMFDIVFTTYAVLGKELDYALFSSKNNLTRGSKRRARPENLREFSYKDYDQGTPEPETSNEAEDDDDLEDEDSQNEVKNQHLADYQSYFQLSLRIKKPKNANEKTNDNQKVTDYEQALQDEIELVLKHNELANSTVITKDYQSPMMLLQFWRVVLDEVQMVSSKISRSFQSAALIPRHHSWGVSGTPIKKNIDDLHSVLSFLKIQPFIGEIGKHSWDLLVKGNNVMDFINLWSNIGLRHTKAMVHDDIKLPPQHRMLMTIPFNAVEQENYNQLLTDCLAAICLDSNGTPVVDDWEPTPTIISVMKQWLVRLRQVCGNPQIGKLSVSAKRYKARHYFYSMEDYSEYRRHYLNGTLGVSNVQALKTLDDVLDDMLNGAINEVINSERKIINGYLDIAQIYELVFSPKEARDTFEYISEIIQVIIARIRFLLDRSIRKFDGLFESDELKEEDEEEDLDDEEREKRKLSKLSDKALKDAQELNEQIKTSRQRLRQWNILLHKCYFLLASSNFQLYDEEYKERIKKFSRPYSPPNIPLDFDPKNINEILVDEKVSVRLINSESILQGFKPVTGLSTGDDNEANETVQETANGANETSEQLKFLEQSYYDLAEDIRSELLQGSIVAVDKTITTRFKNREAFKSSALVDDGSQLLPKSTRKVFKSLPIIETTDFEDNISGMKSKVFVNRVKSLIQQLNNQAEVINDWMSQLIEILSSPLLTHDKDPNGEEYEKSIESQDRASCYLHLLNKLMTDRMEVINGKDTTVNLGNKRGDQDAVDVEMSGINDKDFLKALEATRHSIKPRSKYSFNDLIYEIKSLENDLKDERLNHRSISSDVESNLFEHLSNKLSIMFDNQKLASVLIQKELASSCNSVFNARIEYFKQLQQISDSVKTLDYGLDREDLVSDKITSLFNRFKNYADVSNISLDKSISRFRYLSTLSKINDKQRARSEQIEEDENVEEDPTDDDSLMCIICRSQITIGSLTTCGHKYCKDCLDQWLNGGSHYCPMCKSRISEYSIYNFTHYKPNLKANKAIDGPETKKDKNLYSIYNHIDNEIVEAVQNIQLKESYSSKVDMIVKQVLYLKSKDPKVQIVIFSQWQDLLYILAAAFKNASISYLASYGTLTPEIGGGRRKSKYDSVEEFKKPENGITCFLLNAKAQASGLTLINAQHIFLCEPLVNTSLELQAISRIHRIGQTKVTTVWMFAIENTVEESITLLSTNKRLQYLEYGTPAPETKSNKNSEKGLTAAESMTLMKSGGIDTLVQKGAGEGETVSNGDLWDAFFCANSSKEQRETMNIDALSKID